MRVFIAIELAGDVRAALAQEQERLRAVCAHNREIRWTRPEGWHLTLKFLGEISDQRARQVIGALQALAGFEKFAVEVKGFGFFPDPRRPRVFWAGIEGPPALAELAGRVETVMQELGFPRELRPFRPHLTLARFQKPRPSPELEAAFRNGNSPSFGRSEVSEFFLFESRLRPGGAEYRKVAEFAIPQPQSGIGPEP